MLRTFCRKAAALASRRSYLATSTVTCRSCSTKTSSDWSPPEESKEEYKYVERILPATWVPEPPNHASYPTPSGWVPAKVKIGDHPYHIRRTRFHQLPVYLEIRDGGNRHLTQIRKVEGDIWAFEKDLKEYLEEQEGSTVYTAVDELCCKVRVRGAKQRAVSDFLTEKGF